MAYQAVFKRYELKFLLTRAQREEILAAMEPYMALDKYGHTTIRNIYFDTPDYRLIRRSIEKPAYKEKLRVRSYRETGAESKVFVELKKKYDKVVYKRRVSLPEGEAMAWLCGDKHTDQHCQITAEIDYFLHFYQDLRPAVFLSYEREAYYCKNGGDFRITFDENILCRQEELTFGGGVWGTPLLEQDRVLMEVKCSGGLPLWLTGELSRLGVYKTSFSKYGTAYQNLIYPKEKREHGNVIQRIV